MKILYSNLFTRKYKKLSKNIKDIAKEKEQTFKRNPFDSSLKTHKLSGKLQGFYSFSINHHYRIVFEMLDADVFVFHHVGNHDIYK